MPDRLLGRCVLGLALLAVLGCAGCTSPERQTHSGDILLGEFYPKGANGQPLPPAQPGAAQSKPAATQVPPIPSASSATTNAAIAGNTALPGSRPLGINQPNWTLTNTSINSGQAGSPAGPKVQPVPREATGPMTQANSSTAPIVPTSNWSSTAAPRPLPPLGTLTPEVAEATLLAKGAINLRKETVAEGVRVSCLAPGRANPNSLTFYETTAPNLLDGLQAILGQIDSR